MVDVGRDIEVEIPIAVGIEKRRPRIPSGGLDPRARRHVFEGAIAAVPVKEIRTETGHEQIGPAIVVIVRHRDTASPATLACDTGRYGHILEGAVTAI